jgi:hypothetical protein
LLWGYVTRSVDPEVHRVSRREKSRRNATWIKDLERAPADDLPPTCRLTWIDSSLPACDTNGTDRNSQTWRVAARRRNHGVDGTEVCKPGKKPQHEYAILRVGVPLGHFGGTDSRPLGNRRQIRTSLTSIRNWNLYGPSFKHVRNRSAHTGERVPEHTRLRFQRIEIDRDGSKGRDDVAQARERRIPNRSGDGHSAPIHPWIDHFFPFHKQRGITRFTNSQRLWIHSMQ